MAVDIGIMHLHGAKEGKSPLRRDTRRETEKTMPAGFEPEVATAASILSICFRIV